MFKEIYAKSLTQRKVSDTDLSGLTEKVEKNTKKVEKVIKLHEDHEDHDKIYNMTSSESEELPTANLEKVIDEKQGCLNNEGYGDNLTTVERQIEEHNIFHSDVEALAPHMKDNEKKDHASSLELKYNTLKASSVARHQDLHSLRDYMLQCMNELYWMERQAEDRMTYDWSDDNLYYRARQEQYENISRNALESRQSTIKQLNEDGKRLIAAHHPGSNVIAAYMEAVNADWKEYRSLIFCEGKHLRHMEKYHKFHKEAKDLLELLKSLDTGMNRKYHPDFKDMYQIKSLIADLNDQVKAVDQYGERVQALQKHSQQVLPLKLRRETPREPVYAEALCEFDTAEGKVFCGERYTLFNNSGTEWIVKDPAWRNLSAPGLYFIIPPTDPEAISVSESLSNQLKMIKQKASSCKGLLLTRLEELKKESGTDNNEQLCRQLMAGLDKVNNDLAKQEKAIYADLRLSLARKSPLQDSIKRLQDLTDVEAFVEKIEPEKNSKVQEAEMFLISNHKCASAPQLFTKVDVAKDKYKKVNLLLKCAKEKFLNSNKLENSVQTLKTLLSNYENALAREETLPSDLSAIEKKLEDLSEISSELSSKSTATSEAEQNLRATKTSCEDMVNKIQEHCPDIKKQEREVNNLRKHFDNLCRQVDTRSKVLQRAKAAYNNYCNGYNSLNKWLSQVPNFAPLETDDASQVAQKLKNQRNLLSDIKRKEFDIHSLSKNSLLFQQAIKDYETEREKCRSIIELENGLVLHQYKGSRHESPALNVKHEESAIKVKFTEVKAMNMQILKCLEYAQSLLKQDEKSMEPEKQELSWGPKKQLENDILPENIEMDRKQEQQLRRLTDELAELKSQKAVKENEITEIQRQLNLVSKVTSKGQKDLTEEKVILIKNDPQLENEYSALLESKQNEPDNKVQHEELQEKSKQLEKTSTIAGDKVSIKEVLKGENDIALQRKVENLRLEYENDKTKNRYYQREKEDLQRKISGLEEQSLKVITHEKLREIVQPGPKVENEVDNLNLELLEQQRKTRELAFKLHVLEDELKTLKDRSPQIEYKETIKEVIKYNTDTEIERELEKLKNETAEKQLKAEKSEMEILRLKDEIQTWKDATDHLQTKEIIKEVIQYCEDPKTKAELETLKRKLNEERELCLELETEISSNKEKTEFVRLQVEEELNASLQQTTLEKTEVEKTVGRDPEAELEMGSLRRNLEEEMNCCRELERKIIEMNSRLSDMEFANILKQLNYIKEESNKLQSERKQQQDESEIAPIDTQDITESAALVDENSLQLRLKSLQRELSDLRTINKEKDQEIEELQRNWLAMNVNREQRENHFRRSIFIIDKDTEKEMSPEDAYKLGLITWTKFFNLHSQECDWEEISVKGPTGESSVFHERKSGNKFSIEDALKTGKITREQLQRYHNKEITIQEFANMLSDIRK